MQHSWRHFIPYFIAVGSFKILSTAEFVVNSPWWSGNIFSCICFYMIDVEKRHFAPMMNQWQSKKIKTNWKLFSKTKDLYQIICGQMRKVCSRMHLVRMIRQMLIPRTLFVTNCIFIYYINSLFKQLRIKKIKQQICKWNAFYD